MTTLPLLAAAGLLAGAMNAIAGGGSFVTFPAMVFAGLPPIVANAPSTVALFPGTIASTFAYRRDLHGVGGYRLIVLAPISFVRRHRCDAAAGDARPSVRQRDPLAVAARNVDIRVRRARRHPAAAGGSD
jgi:hypothetical protein